MGCRQSNTLKCLVKTPLKHLKDVSGNSEIFVTKDRTLWKVVVDEVGAIDCVVRRNSAIAKLPPSPYILPPRRVCRLTDTKVAISMQQSDMDLFSWLALPFDEQELVDGLNAVANGIRWLHAQGIAHHDVKVENVVVGPTFRLIDFDFACPLAESNNCGTPKYLPVAEFLENWPCSTQSSSRRLDVHAFGKLVLHALSSVSFHNYIPIKFFPILKEFFDSGCCEVLTPPDIGPLWTPWLKAAVRCCQSFPPEKIDCPPGNELVSTSDI